MKIIDLNAHTAIVAGSASNVAVAAGVIGATAFSALVGGAVSGAVTEYIVQSE